MMNYYKIMLGKGSMYATEYFKGAFIGPRLVIQV